MRIVPIVVSKQNYKADNKIKNNVTFKSDKLRRYELISQSLKKNGIYAYFRGNDFGAECVEKTIKIFENLFGKEFLPKTIGFDLLDGCYGCYNLSTKQVSLNANLTCFDNLESLKKEMNRSRRWLLPDKKSTLHPARTFVHEFAHCAHHTHLDILHNGSGELIMNKLRQTQVPTAIGKLITMYKLGSYSLDTNGGMNEFMAERISQDICEALTENSWEKISDIDVDYSNIFSKKWQYRYSSPQSYIDYFTQQVWDGKIEEAKRVGEDAQEYLKRIGAFSVPVTVKKIETKTEHVPILKNLSAAIKELATLVTQDLDKKNDLVIKKEN